MVINALIIMNNIDLFAFYTCRLFMKQTQICELSHYSVIVKSLHNASAGGDARIID